MQKEFIDDRNRKSQLRLNSVSMAGVTAAHRAYFFNARQDCACTMDGL
jgi:hypothetical protein